MINCPDEFVSILCFFHNDMKVWVNAGSYLSEIINVKNGVKQIYPQQHIL